jgi:hypothetical protein
VTTNIKASTDLRPAARPRRRVLRSAVLPAAVVALVAALILDRKPVHLSFLDGRDREARGGAPPSGPRGAPLLIVDGGRVAESARSGRFSKMDWSYAWTALLEQEYGAAQAIAPAAFRPLDQAKDSTLAVVSRSVAAAPPTPELLEALQRFAAGGGAVVLEEPHAGYRPVSGVTLADAGGETPGHQAPLAPFLDDRHHEELARLELPLGVRGVRETARDVRAALRSGGLPALWQRPYGKGAVLTVAFPLSTVLVSLQQGVPTGDDFTVGKRHGRYAFVREPQDLLAHPSLETATLPFADLLERAVSLTADLSTPRARWWHLPHGAPGAFLMTHDGDFSKASEAEDLLRVESRAGVPSTHFLIADPRLRERWPRTAVQRFRRAGVDLQFHWNRFPMAFGVGPVEPFLRVFSAASQVSILRRVVGEGARASRIHYLDLGPTWTGAFRALAAAGVRLDSTYGPNRGGRGYLMGTGLPFPILDTDGLPLPIRELPFVHQENWGGEDPAFFETLFRASRERHHEAIVSLLHPHLEVRKPAGRELWQAVLSQARAHDHVAVTMTAMLQFLDARAGAPLTSRFSGRSLHVEATASAAGLAVAAPAAPLGLRFRSTEIDGRPAVPIELSLEGRPYVVVPLRAGKHTVVFNY